MSKLLSASSNGLLLFRCPLNAWTRHFFRVGENSKEKAILERSLGQLFAFWPSDVSLSHSALLCSALYGRSWAPATAVPRLLCPWASDWFQPMGGAGRRLLGGRKWEVQVFLPISLYFGLGLWQWLYAYGSSSCLAGHPLWSPVVPDLGMVVVSHLTVLWIVGCSPICCFSPSNTLETSSQCWNPSFELLDIDSVFLTRHWVIHTPLSKTFSEGKNIYIHGLNRVKKYPPVINSGSKILDVK